jgi:penicillin V acylase-like amidase (Ntn superfamily)
MTYTINTNTEFNSIEISFDGKPTEEIRNALKQLRFRWHSVKKVWYGYSTEETARAAIEGKTTEQTTNPTKTKENKYGVKVGDLFSASRFVRAAFVKLNSVAGDTEEANVNQFFHILNSVAMPRGCVQMPQDRYEITLYSGCCNADKGIYYYTTYENSRICAVDMHREKLDSNQVVSYPLLHKPDFFLQNHSS